MSPEVRAIKKVAAKLSAKDLIHLVGWCHRLAERKNLEARSGPSDGIPPGSLLKAFRRVAPKVPDASLGATALMDFYEKTRVRGCRFEDDADMLLIEWGFDRREPFLCLTRQVIPPGARDEIWQLSVDYRYEPSDAPKNLTTANRLCHSLKELETFMRFIYSSRIVSHFSKKTPTSVSVTYQNVE